MLMQLAPYPPSMCTKNAVRVSVHRFLNGLVNLQPEEQEAGPVTAATTDPFSSPAAAAAHAPGLPLMVDRQPMSGRRSMSDSRLKLQPVVAPDQWAFFNNVIEGNLDAVKEHTACNTPSASLAITDSTGSSI